jgi:excisionase family DNA binding protein
VDIELTPAQGRAVTERLLTAREIAHRLGLSVDTVLRWSRDGRMPAGFRLASGVLRWDANELEAWLEDRRQVVAVAGMRRVLTTEPGLRPATERSPRRDRRL